MHTRLVIVDFFPLFPFTGPRRHLINLPSFSMDLNNYSFIPLYHHTTPNYTIPYHRRWPVKDTFGNRSRNVNSPSVIYTRTCAQGNYVEKPKKLKTGIFIFRTSVSTIKLNSLCVHVGFTGLGLVEKHR